MRHPVTDKRRAQVEVKGELEAVPVTRHEVEQVGRKPKFGPHWRLLSVALQMTEARVRRLVRSGQLEL
jgi:hypothetical protein